MEDVVVKVFQGEAEVASEAIFSPATDAEAKDCLQDTNAAWVGKLTEPNRSPGLVGRRRNLTPGAIYHLHLQEQSGSEESKKRLKEALREDREVRECEAVKTIRLVGSKASCSGVKEACKRLRITFDPTRALTPTLKQRLAPVPETAPFEWIGHEDDAEQIERVRAHLQNYYAPPGVKVISATGAEWLDATFDDARVVIEGAKTDFVFLAEEAFEVYELQAGAIESDRLLAALPGILALYETKTPDGLFKELSRVQAQAKVECLAVNTMSENSGMLLKPFVVLGDLERHFIFEKFGNTIHMTSTKPADLPYAIQHIKNLLLQRAQEAHVVLPIRLTPPDHRSGGNGQGDFGPDRLQLDSASDPHDPMLGGGGSLGTAHKTSALSDSSRPPSSGPLPACSGFRDDDGDDALREAAFSQDLVQMLRTPSFYRSLGLPGPPTTIRHMTLEEWVDAKKFLPPPARKTGCSLKVGT